MKQTGRCGAVRSLASIGLWCAIAGCSTNEYPGHEPSGQGGKTSTGTSSVALLGGTTSQIGIGGIANSPSTANGGVSNPASGGSSEVGGQNGLAGNAGAANEVCSVGLSSCAGEPPCTSDLASGTASGATYKNCGSCGLTCALVNATGAACAAGKCVTSCEAGYGDCNAGAFNDGCESNLNTSAAACGSCGRACSTAGALTVSCAGGICVPTCDQKHGDCNQGLGTGTDDGCEVYFDELNRCGTNCTNGVVCPSNQVCNAGTCGAAQGLVVFTVPLSANGQIQRYADKLTALPNLSGSEIVVRIYAPGATAGTLAVYVQDQNYVTGGWASFPLVTLSKGWSDIKLQVGEPAGSYDPKHVNQITFEVMADGSGPWASPTVVYIDSIRSVNGILNDSFDTTIGGMVGSGMQVVSGSKLDWAASMPPNP